MRQRAWTVLATIALLLVALFAFGGCVAERVNTQGMTTEEKLVTRRPSIGSTRLPTFRHPPFTGVYEQQTGEKVGVFITVMSQFSPSPPAPTS